MTVRRWALACAALVVGLVLGVGVGVAFAAQSAPTVVFEYGGAACIQANCVGNSANAAPGQTVSVSSGSSWIVAAGDQQVMCRIIVGGKLVAEAHAVGAGQRAFCAFG